VKIADNNAGERPRLQFCGLEYRPHGRSGITSRAAQVVLIVLKDEEGNLSFFVDPELRTIVESEDLAYFESLLEDFREQAKLHPEELFKQLCSLGVGPLVTHKAGERISDHPHLQELHTRFVRL
jgi:hypothetical protein